MVPLVLSRGFSGCLRVPEDFAVAGVNRHHMGIAGGQEDFIFGDGDAANPAITGGLVGADAGFPNQIAGLAVERLYDVAGACEVNDAVVDDRRGLIRP